VSYKDEDTLRREYQNNSIGQLADKYDVSKSVIHYWIKKFDIKTRKHPKEKHISLRTNVWGSNPGYEIWQARVDGEVKRVQHHRLLMVAEHGFDAVSDNVVHHINEIQWDNRPDNLKILTDEEHKRHHSNAQERENGTFI
jgi:hypothetical protein